jgi:LPXTG-site transpeptidase (sortase) family protein
MRELKAVILMALLLGACGAEQAIVPTSVPAQAPAASSAPAPTQPGTNPTLAATEPTLARKEATTVPLPTEAAVQPPKQATSVPAATKQPVAPTEQPLAALEQASQPVRILINDIGVDFKIVSVGLDKNRVPIVPDHNVGWYNLSAMPGQGENVVLWGHVLRFRNAPNIPAPFARLKELKPGAKVVLYDKAGKEHNYTVKQQIWVTPNQVEYILPRGQEFVTLVSCIGDKVIVDGEVVDESHRLITIAEPDA